MLPHSLRATAKPSRYAAGVRLAANVPVPVTS
jgi:hypothetical protein